MSTPEQCLLILEDTALLLQKAQTNLKKCPKQRLTKGYIETRIQSINEYWDTFRNAHQSLVKCVPKEKKSEISYFTNEDYYIYEDLYSCLLADLRDLLSTFTHIKPGEANSSVEGQVKLPRIQLPIFSGVYDEWPTFKDLFISLVHKNASLSNVQRLHYLKSSITGDAQALLKHIQVTETNYEQAWNTLSARYGNKKLIVNSLLKKLFYQRKIPSQTANHIKSLLDTTNECLNSLQNLKISTDSWDPIIIFLTVQKLDPESHRDWEEFAYREDMDELPKWEDLTKFLQTKFRTLELIAPPSKEKPISKSQHTVHVVTSDTAKLRNCILCEDNHTLTHCREFTKLEPNERCEVVKKHNLCFNCLAIGHTAIRCRLNMYCRKCNKRHHTLVHTSTPISSPNKPDAIQGHHSEVEEEEISNTTDPEELNVELSSHFTKLASTALLATALVPVRDEAGRTTVLRALVDYGSQATFISERAAQLLHLKRIPVHGTITGVGSTQTVVKHATYLEILSSHDKNFRLKVKAYIMATRLTTQLPSQRLPTRNWAHLQGLILADPGFNQPGRIDILLGVEICAQILKSEVIKGPPGTPCAQNTSLGWILFGKILDDQPKHDFTVMHLNLDLEDMLKTMWELETEDKRLLTSEERKCEDIYKATHSRADDGRYIVNLPKKKNEMLSTQGQTRDIAMTRLYHLERRFEKNIQLKTEYVKVMEEYERMNHMEEVPKEEMENPAVYLPHHAIIKQEKETTKVRTVFNASQKGKNNISLNDELLVGPQLQENMRSLIIRWRLRKVCFVADIQKMYRQILVAKEDRDLQRIVWRSHHQDPVKDYRMTRVTFGTASAPYLAVKTMQQIADDEGANYPDAARVIKEDFYMDDLMSGKDSLQEAVTIAKEVDILLRKGGFVLQKWCSNSAEFLKQFEPSLRSCHANIDITIDGTIRALGLSWNMGRDVFQYKLNLPRQADIITKRISLGDIQRLFDPLGWLAPAILPAKLLIQRLWLQAVTWDDEVDTEIKEEWLDLRSSLHHINSIEIKRWLHTQSYSMEKVTVHGFCDASNRAYAAVAYLRVPEINGKIKTCIIAAKTRVAPIKPVSLPRLELCGAVLLSRLLKQIKEATRIPAKQIFAWTDSTIVLSWLFGDPARWHTFVKNRVVEVLDNIGNNWYHVPTYENPADPASRGLNLIDLKENNLWWEGPQWLRKEEIPYNRPSNLATNLEKIQTIQINMKIGNEKLDRLEVKFGEFESLNDLLKAITYCKRFLKGRKMEDKDIAMTTKELDDSLEACIKITQKISFEEEINSLIENKCIKRESRLKTLHPFMDKKNILRVGGRLRHADLDYDGKYPIILDCKNNLAALIVGDAHLKTLHGGVQLMLGFLRSKFWIFKAKKLVKAKIHKCLTCAKQCASSKPQLMGDLPKVRVTPSRAFLHSGVDFAGPYKVLTSKGRNLKTSKAYVSIFICMCTKAIHLELAGDLTSESFIGAFRRFVARRGKCAHLWSDQGRNFVGANKELVTAWSEARLHFDGPIAEQLAVDGTQWHFIPAYSPHMGGLWEAGVKSLKHHLRRVLTSHLTFEEMSTLLCQIEACLNSRPLSPIDEAEIDPITPLTPGHFLIGEAPITIPSPDLADIPTNRLSRWQHLQKLLSHFWKRWQSEYLSRLQQRPKWLKRNEELDIGNIVLIKQDNLPPGKWMLGRIVDKHPGADGVTRVYRVKSGDSIVQRSINKLCPLPIDTATE